MPSGLSVPLRVGPSGRTRISTGEEQDRKIIMLALGDDDNENAYMQGIGLGAAMVFDVADPSLRAKVKIRLRAIFARFEQQKRFRLMEETIAWTEPVDGEIELSFRYINLETDEPSTYAQRLKNGGKL